MGVFPPYAVTYFAFMIRIQFIQKPLLIVKWLLKQVRVINSLEKLHAVLTSTLFCHSLLSSWCGLPCTNHKTRSGKTNPPKNLLSGWQRDSRNPKSKEDMQRSNSSAIQCNWQEWRKSKQEYRPWKPNRGGGCVQEQVAVVRSDMALRVCTFSTKLHETCE